MDGLMSNIIAGLIVVLIVAAAGAALARDRLPLRFRNAPLLGSNSVPIEDRPDHTLPPSFVFPTRPSTPPPDEWNDTERYISWAVENGGVHAGKLFHRFTVRGTEKSPVSLDRVAVRVLERRPPLRGFVYDTASGGDSTERWIAADLDQTDNASYATTELTVDEWDPTVRDYMQRPWTLLEVSTTDPETFVLAASTEQWDCDFVVEIHYRGEHQSGVLRVQPGSRPFRVTAV